MSKRSIKTLHLENVNLLSIIFLVNTLRAVQMIGLLGKVCEIRYLQTRFLKDLYNILYVCFSLRLFLMNLYLNLKATCNLNLNP